jgi:hypothetical protein
MITSFQDRVKQPLAYASWYPLRPVHSRRKGIGLIHWLSDPHPRRDTPNKILKKSSRNP